MSLRFHAVASAGACLGGGTKAVCPSVVANSKAKKPTARTSLGVFPCIQAGAYRDMQNWDHHHFLISHMDTAGSRYSSLAPLYKVCVNIVIIIPWSAGPYCFPEQGNIQNPTEKEKPSHQTVPKHWQIDWTLFSPGPLRHLQPVASSHALWPYPWLPCGCAPWSWSQRQAIIHPTTTINLI